MGHDFVSLGAIDQVNSLLGALDCEQFGKFTL